MTFATTPPIAASTIIQNAPQGAVVWWQGDFATATENPFTNKRVFKRGANNTPNGGYSQLFAYDDPVTVPASFVPNYGWEMGWWMNTSYSFTKLDIHYLMNTMAGSGVVGRFAIFKNSSVALQWQDFTLAAAGAGERGTVSKSFTAINVVAGDLICPIWALRRSGGVGSDCNALVQVILS